MSIPVHTVIADKEISGDVASNMLLRKYWYDNKKLYSTEHIEAYSFYVGEKLIIIKEIKDEYHRADAYFMGLSKLDIFIEPETSDEKLKLIINNITGW